MPPDVTRRDLIRAGGAGAAGFALLGSNACSEDEPGFKRAKAPPGAKNVVVVVMDSLRQDHIYGPRARTTRMDAFAKEALRFSNAYPEGMPTIPARRAIMSGRRTFPFRGWREFKQLPPEPGWEPVGSDGQMFTEFLRTRGWTVGYVTDNPHLLLPVHRRFRATFDRVELVDGQVPVRRKPKRRVSQATVDRHLPPSMRGGRAEPRMRAYLASNPRNRPESEFNAAKVFGQGMGWIEWARSRQPFALVVDSFDAHEPWDAPQAAHRHLRTTTSRRRRADPTVSDARGPDEGAGAEPGARPPDAPALRRRGDLDRRLARPFPRPAGQPRPG